jgi:hypothetical protein
MWTGMGRSSQRINGMIDTSKVVWIANEGIRASVILEGRAHIFSRSTPKLRR